MIATMTEIVIATPTEVVIAIATMTEIVMITTAATELAIQSDFEGFDVVPNTEIAVEAKQADESW